MTYRRKPILVEAFQMTIENRHDNSKWPEWLHEAWNKRPSEIGSLYVLYPEGPTDLLAIYTPGGGKFVNCNDWIIKDQEGKIYPCDPSIFRKIYEAVPLNGD